MGPDEGADNGYSSDGRDDGAREEIVAGRFRVERGVPIPEGRGEVLVAYDEMLGRRVVLKRTDPGEARAFAKLGHPYIVTVYDYLTVGEGPRAGTWLVMEYVPNGSLSNKTFTHAEAARIGAQIADALGALHRKGLAHCDVKPANIVVDGEGTAKLTDFDAALRIGGLETISPVRPISYTPDYAAPEIIRGNPATASDIFSLGATLYALVTGAPPPRWAHTTITAGEGDDQDPPDVPGSLGWKAGLGVIELPPELGSLRPALAAMLQVEPDKRPTAVEASRRLHDIADPPTLWRKVRDTAKRRWPIITTGGTAAVVLAVLAAIAWGPDRDDRRAAPAPTSSSPASNASTPPGRTHTTARISAYKGQPARFGNCQENCAFIEFRATGLEPNTEYHFVPYTSSWGAFNVGAGLTTDDNGELHVERKFPCNAVNQTVWVIAEIPGEQPVVSNKFTWKPG